MATLIAWLVVLTAAICVVADSARLGARRGALGGGMLDMGPAGWFLSCLIAPLVGFICYLATRPRLVTRHRALTAVGWVGNPAIAYAGAPAQPMPTLVPPRNMHPPLAPLHVLASAPPAAPAGWYADFNSPSGRRWWDGAAWTAHI